VRKASLQKMSVVLFFLLAVNFAKGQGGYAFAFYIGLPLQIEPMADAGMQLKHYWVFDTNRSNDGIGAGCEINFGYNNSGITVGPKLFYQVDVYMADIGSKKKKSGLYIVGRMSVIRYANSMGSDIRIAPEGGISLFDLLTLTYGYNFPLPVRTEKKILGVFDNRLTLFITINSKGSGKK
jgi:hypothetical protein